MNLSESFFVSEKLHEKTVELSNGEKHVLHFRELPGSEFSRFRDHQNSDDQEVRIMAIPRAIQASLRTPDGKEAITTEQAMKLKAPVMNALLTAAMEVNTFTEKKPSPSEEESGSSTS